jgi:hypothetical protein
MFRHMGVTRSSIVSSNLENLLLHRSLQHTELSPVRLSMKISTGICLLGTGAFRVTLVQVLSVDYFEATLS